jgi:adenylate cyclase class IV
VFLTAIGYPQLFQIKKRREVFKRGDLTVTFDEWPIIGCILELEGREEEIKELANRVAPNLEFKNYRLKELFRSKEVETGRSLAELQIEYEAKTGFLLGRLDLLLD